MDDWERLQHKIISCRLCPRLVAWREEVAQTKRRAYRDWDYWGKPVPGFGDRQARVLIFGLAPGAHGSNRTGRMFTGDASGDFLYRALHREGFASQPESRDRSDGLALRGVFISAVCRCVPPDNKPNSDEVNNCRAFLETEMEYLTNLQGIVALGKIAFDQVLVYYRMKGKQLAGHPFGHGAFYRLGDGLPWLLASYHPSRQNTQTGRLTEAMFGAIWKSVRELIV